MKTSLTKTEKVIALAAVVAISIFFATFIQVSRGTKNSPQFDTDTQIDYTMARPDQVYSEYTLAGRELDRSFQGLPAEQSKTYSDKKKQELIAKKVAEIKKKEEIKKQQPAAFKTQQQALTASEHKEQSFKTYSAGEKNKSKKETADNSTYNASAPNNSYSEQANHSVNSQSDADNQEIKVHKKTAAEWRDLLFSKPTTESLTLLITALRKHEVTVSEYQVLSQDLVAQSDVKLKGLGLMALRSFPSLQSLSQLVHLETATLGPLQSYAEESINAYLQIQNLEYLNQALLTPDKKLVLKALSLLSRSFAKFEQGDFSALEDPRNRREGEALNFSMANYRILLPALTQLGSSQDLEVSSLAQQIVPRI